MLDFQGMEEESKLGTMGKKIREVPVESDPSRVPVDGIELGNFQFTLMEDGSIKAIKTKGREPVSIRPHSDNSFTIK